MACGRRWRCWSLKQDGAAGRRRPGSAQVRVSLSTRADGVERFMGEPVVLDTGLRRVTGRGVKAIHGTEPGGNVVIYLRLGPLGWIRFDHWLVAQWAVNELSEAINAALHRPKRS